MTMVRGAPNRILERSPATESGNMRSLVPVNEDSRARGAWFAIPWAMLLALSACGGQTVGGAGTGVGGGSGGTSGGPTAGGAGTGTSSTGGGAGTGDNNDASPSESGATSGGGSPTDLSKPWKSTGCGKPLPATQVPTIPGSRTGYTEFFVNQTGATIGTPEPTKAGMRQFFVRVPADYDSNKPYRVEYVLQGCGGYRAANTNTYPLFAENQGGTEQAIYVAVSIPDNNANPNCYDNNSGSQSQEWEAFDLIHAFVEKTYCADNNRIYVGGYGSGGWVANMWGCYFGGIPTPPRKFSPRWAVRGHGSVEGSLPPNQPVPCNGPSAGFWLHDSSNVSNLLATEIAALNLSLRTNGCTGNYADGPKKPWAPVDATGKPIAIPTLEGNVCQEYTGCPADVAKNYPLVFCTTNCCGHSDQSTSAVPGLTTFFDLMNPTP
jgi:hypothetical protein